LDAAKVGPLFLDVLIESGLQVVISVLRHFRGFTNIAQGLRPELIEKRISDARHKTLGLTPWFGKLLCLIFCGAISRA
jgi:hypothetical protein